MCSHEDYRPGAVPVPAEPVMPNTRLAADIAENMTAEPTSNLWDSDAPYESGDYDADDAVG